MKKLFLAFAACLMAFSISAAELNIYASGLKAGALSAEKKLTIDYVLNAPATTLEFQVLNASGIAVKTIAITGDANLSKGAHTGVVIDLSGCPAGEFTWALKASAEANDAYVEVTPTTEGLYNYYLAQGVAVNVYPDTEYFGYIYVTEACNGQTDGSSQRADNMTEGVYIYNPLLEDYSDQKWVGYAGGVTWGSTNQTDGPKRISIAEDGYVFVSDMGTTTTGVWMMDPANPSANFKEVLDITQRGTTFTQVHALEVLGSGADKILYTLDGFKTDSEGLNVYPVGECAIPYAAAPTKLCTPSAIQVVNSESTKAVNQPHCSLKSDGKGGFWVVQYRGTNASTHPALLHINSNGKCDYSVPTTLLAYASGNEASARGVVGLSPNGELIAVGSNDRVVICSITYDTNGVPTELTKVTETVRIGNNVDGIAFDYASNMYIVSGSSEKFYAYATPKSDNSCVTPAQAKYGFEIEAAAGTVLAGSITINEGAAATLEKGATKQLTTTVLPAETTNKTVLWSSDAEDIATVENGLITAIAPGEATITASIDAVATTFKVTVKKPVVKITEASQDLAKGSTLQLHATLTPEDASATIVWATSDETTVSVSNAGLVTAVNSGKATITAKTADSEVASIEITVPASPIAAGTYNVGGAEADYTSLAAACEDLNRNGILGDVTLAICADLTEPKNIGLVNTSDYTITIRPDGETLRTITFTQGGSSAITGSLVIGAANPVGSDVTTATQNVIIDGFAEGSEVSTLAFVHDNLGGSLRVADGSNNIIRNITSSYGENSSGTRYQIRLTGTNNDIIGCTIIGNRSSRVVVLESTEDALIEGNTFEISGLAEASLAYGIHGYSVTGTVTIRGNKFTKVESPSAADKGVAALSTQGGSWIIENNYFAGMDFTNATADTKARINYIRTIIAANKTIIRHNTFYIPSLSNKPANADNKVCAIAAEGTGASATVENNLFVSAEESAQHAFFYGNTMTISNNVFHTVAENAKAYIVGNNALAAYLESDATAKSAEPKFADAAHGDLSLVEGGEGLLVSSIADVTTDIEGTKRGAEKAYAGAFEYVDPGTGTAIENTNVEQTNVRKVIENGQMIIIRDGIRYNVMGVRMN